MNTQLFDQYSRQIQDELYSFEGLKGLYGKLYEEVRKLDIFLKLMIERFDEKLDDPSTKESKTFKDTSDKYVATERALKHCEYYLTTRYPDKIKALQVEQ